MDFALKLDAALTDERQERERHKLAIASIIARRDKLLNAIEALREFYPDVELDNTVNYVDVAVAADGHVSIISAKDANDPDGAPDGRKDAGQLDEGDPNGGFARGEMKYAMIDVLTKADTFMTTDEIASALRDRFPDRKFSNKRVTDALKDNRRRKDIIGENVYRGKFPMFINGLPHFYADLATLELKQEYNKKYEQRMQELGFTPGPLSGQEAAETSALAESRELTDPEPDTVLNIEISDEEIAHSHALLQRPKTQVALF